MKNECSFIGRITADPEIRYTPGGDAVTNFNVACEEKWKDKSGKEQKKVVFPKFVAFKSQAGLISKTIKTGDLVFVEGRYQVRVWDGQDGKKNYDHHFALSRIYKCDFLKVNETSQDMPVNGMKVTADDIPF